MNFITLYLLVFPALRHAKGNNNLFRVGLELQTGYGIVAENGFIDRKSIVIFLIQVGGLSQVLPKHRHIFNVLYNPVQMGIRFLLL